MLPATNGSGILVEAFSVFLLSSSRTGVQPVSNVLVLPRPRRCTSHNCRDTLAHKSFGRNFFLKQSICVCACSVVQ